MKKKLKEIFEPTFPKIILYTFLAFIVPTFIKVCSETGCEWQFRYLAGYRLVFGNEFGMLTFGMQMLMFVIAYLFSALTISLFNALKKRQRL
ncbi:MAG: hypothetical protein KKA65_01570 [Nanoarchaeota archaeon]|nr:hypothetical protein [Nanoarchaeota archaeon]MBU4241970.1 hypothetical protein [Nanoarchaeota archaeon]MBU4351574.1 hypothetical protein [Nanoarchaeota archaeon]MBU4456166.1 hypothetical protein [Nanoarchaeota archaeon]MCG2720349.1 hypothetical protein [Nanoarchaeota archaeon]